MHGCCPHRRDLHLSPPVIPCALSDQARPPKGRALAVTPPMSVLKINRTPIVHDLCGGTATTLHFPILCAVDRVFGLLELGSERSDAVVRLSGFFCKWCDQWVDPGELITPAFN